MIRIAFDIGGTFTDFVLHDSASADMRFSKVPSTPGNPAEAVLAGIDALFQQLDIKPEHVEGTLHATTVATNAILERKGNRTALVTTKGFRDVLLIARQKRYDTNDLYLVKPTPLVERADIFEVGERMAPDGEVLAAIDGADVETAIQRLAEGHYESVAIVFLHAYANDAHEKAVRDSIGRALPDLELCISSEVSPKFREYERTSTTVANAYVKPLVGRYLGELEGALKARGFPSDLFIMQSNGGLVPPELARDNPIRIVESGPAAGVLMCAVVGRDAGFDHVMTFDMGGTTAKLGAIDDGEPAIVSTFEVDAVQYKKGSGLPLNISAVELLEIGAGGGSIARTDMGLISVGPESAGADPGPMCYGAGGERPTITDANLVLGYLNPEYFNGGAMALDPVAAAKGIEAHIARPLGLTVQEAAWGIHSVANSNMERAMRVVSIERGRDPPQLRPRRLRRCRARARTTPGAGRRDSEIDRSLWGRRRLRHRPARSGLEDRRDHDARPPPGRRPRRRDRRDIRKPGDPGPARTWRGWARPWSRCGSAAPPCATPDRASRSGSSCRAAESIRHTNRRPRTPSTRPMSAATATKTRTV